MKCTQYELYGQAAFKNARAVLVFEVGQSGPQFLVGIMKFKICFVGVVRRYWIEDLGPYPSPPGNLFGDV